MRKWCAPFVPAFALSCFASVAFAAEPFTVSTMKYGGSSESLYGTFSGEYSWAPPVLTVRLKEGTIKSTRVNTEKGSPIEIRAILCEDSSVGPAYFNRLITSTPVALNESLQEGESIDVRDKKLVIQVRGKTKKDLQSCILGFQISWRKKIGGYITMMASHTYLFSNKETEQAKRMQEIYAKIATTANAALPVDEKAETGQ